MNLDEFHSEKCIRAKLRRSYSRKGLSISTMSDSIMDIEAGGEQSQYVQIDNGPIKLMT